MRPCRPDHPNAIVWDSKYKSAGPLSKVLYNSMGWETDYTFRIPCQVIRNPKMSPSTGTVLAFDMDNYIGRAAGKKDEVIIPAKEQESPADEEHDEAKSYYYPPDEDEPQEIREMEEKFQQAVDLNNKLFGTPVFQHEEGIRKLCSNTTGDNWEMLTPARPLDISHTVDAETVDNLLLEIIDDPPVLPPQSQEYPNTPINVNINSEEV